MVQTLNQVPLRPMWERINEYLAQDSQSTLKRTTFLLPVEAGGREFHPVPNVLSYLPNHTLENGRPIELRIVELFSPMQI